MIGEIAGIDSLPLTQQRSQGFTDALKQYGFKVGPRQAAQFTVQSGQSVAASMLQATKHFDAIWNHDDDQGIGVLAAIKQANRSEFFMVGGAGSANVMRLIKAGNSVAEGDGALPADDGVLRHPDRAADRSEQGHERPGAAEIPASITLYSATVTKDNVDQYLPQGFES